MKSIIHFKELSRKKQFLSEKAEKEFQNNETQSFDEVYEGMMK